jgi:hypothetical protein
MGHFVALGFVSRRDRPAPSLALLLDRPQPVGFVLVGIVGGRRRDQLRAFLTEVLETSAHALLFIVYMSRA